MSAIKEVPLAYTIPALQMIKVTDQAPISGRIRGAVMHFPPGCNALVHVAFGVGDTWLVPSEVNTFISLDDATPTFVLNHPVKQGQYLWADIRNGDAVNPHAISVIARIEGEGE